MRQETPQVVDHLFRQEAGKLIAHLTRIFGLDRLELAEDVVQDTLCRALELWPLQGVPTNPSAWLMRVARNRAIDLMRRDTRFQHLAAELAHLLQLGEELPEETADFTQTIQDDQLRMIFSCCHPELATEAQITIILKTLCGFSVAEIAHAFLTSADAIEKRLGRARKLLRQPGAFVELTPAAEIPARLAAVYRVIYLLFNEGYHGSRSAQTVREELCFEALRLALLLSEHPHGDKPRTHALVALFCFHAARLPGRMDEAGELIQLEVQDRTKWDAALIAQGFHFLAKAALGVEVSEYHLEAGIAALHCAAATYAETEWAKILALYDRLYQLTPSPIIALNRAIALGNALGPEAGLAALKQIPNLAKLKDYPFYPAAQAEFHWRAGQPAAAAQHLLEAVRLAQSPSAINYFERKLKACQLAATPDRAQGYPRAVTHAR